MQPIGTKSGDILYNEPSQGVELDSELGIDHGIQLGNRARNRVRSRALSTYTANSKKVVLCRP